MPSTVTRMGETWDEISYRCFGDEHHVSAIIEINLENRDIVRFPQGVSIELPVLTSASNQSLPPWKRK
ncbi:MAG: tail protein X [Victivallales bacterium]|nr:tail protein X [Victivallales bacterium]MBR5024164.1 tail protein X [Victivallales bacterium]